MTRVSSTLLALACAAILTGQSLAAAPASSAPRLDPDLATLSAAPRHALPDAAVRDALERADRPARPHRFAVPVATDLKLSQGRWRTLADGSASWRLRLHSPGARSLGARLAPLALPAGAELWVYTPRSTIAYGPYREAPSGLWTPVVPGDELVLEVRAPAAAKPAVTLQVVEAFHGYEDPFKAGGPGASGPCNVDADCEPEWDLEARSVALITIANQYFCSGQLLNNVEQDERALFLTARHCGIHHDRGPVESTKYYFNYAAQCGRPAPALPDNPVEGATFLADDEPSDFTLLQLNGPLPQNVYFAGWSAMGEVTGSGASLHHPSGDDRKISIFNTPIAQASVNIGTQCAIDAWEVHWASGTTEGGSSGGGLWNSDHKLIGILSGGTASCERPTGADFFARFERAWTPGTARDNQLKVHLDPEDTCIAEIPGREPGDPAGPITSGRQRCEGPAGLCRRGDGGGGGGLPPTLLLAFLAAALRRKN